MRCRWEMSRWDKIAHCHAVFTVLKVYLCLVGGGLTLSLCCGMSVALIRFSKKVETVSASLHLMNESHVSFTFQLFCFSVNSLLLLWKKKEPLTTLFPSTETLPVCGGLILLVWSWRRCHPPLWCRSGQHYSVGQTHNDSVYSLNGLSGSHGQPEAFASLKTCQVILY